MYKYSGARVPPTSSISPSTRTPQSSTSSQHPSSRAATAESSAIRDRIGTCVLRAFSLEACRPTTRPTHSTWTSHPNGVIEVAEAPPTCENGRDHASAVQESRRAPSRVRGACTGMHKSSSASCLRAPRLVSGTNCNEWTQSPRRRARFPIVLHTVVVSCTLAQTQALW